MSVQLSGFWVPNSTAITPALYAPSGGGRFSPSALAATPNLSSQSPTIQASNTQPPTLLPFSLKFQSLPPKHSFLIHASTAILLWVR